MRCWCFIPSAITPRERWGASWAGYGTDATLEVEFRSGAVYRYFAVPRRVFEEFLAAESKGSFFNRIIKPRYPVAHVVAPP
jgi:hypothetical protein